MIVPWIVSWSGEEEFEVRPCRYAGGLAIWQPQRQGDGVPRFAKPHAVRQRKAMAEMRCSLCGERTGPEDRWWFALGEGRMDLRHGLMTEEPPLHRACATIAAAHCPNLRAKGWPASPMPMPQDLLRQIVGGLALLQDFGIADRGRIITGHLKLGWRYDPRPQSEGAE
ncbi:hypothetical protein [Frigidibacter oleivorans]|uniref:hypothetical protein n=1 Tax=Frigidibacter oleivorans TaxID=2487129 RepID=UPI000F8C6709|nr:hypothetical protein [Frigidibacter oleivorans]